MAHFFEKPYRNSFGKVCFSENVKEAIFFMFFIHICLCLNRSHFTMCLLWINPTFHPPNDVFNRHLFLPTVPTGMEELSTLEAETLKDVMSAVQQLDLKMKN